MKYLILTIMLFLSYTASATSTPRDVDNVYNSGNYVLAETLLLDVVQSHPTARAHYRLGEVYAQQNRHAKALEEFNKAAGLDPSLSFVKDKNEFKRLIAKEQSKLVTRSTVSQPASLSVLEQERKYSQTWLIIIGVALCVLILLRLYARAINRQRND